jgi:hypothetical protein
MSERKLTKLIFNVPSFREANYNARIEQIQQRDNIDAKFGYEKVNDAAKRVAWLVNFQAVILNYKRFLLFQILV